MSNVCITVPTTLSSSSSRYCLQRQSLPLTSNVISRLFHSAPPLRSLSQTSQWRPSSQPTFRPCVAFSQHFTRQFHTSSPCLKKPSGNSPKAVPRKPAFPKPPDGARIPFGAMSKDTLRTIFNHNVPYVEGNEVLRMLQDRRTTGALVDQGIQPESPTVIPAESILHALQWLRQKYPIDEKLAAERWAAVETARLEQEYIARAERLGLYKSPDALNPTAASHHSSQSALEEFQKYHKEKRIREEKEKEKSGEAQKSRELSVARREETEKVLAENESLVAERRAERARAGMVSTDDSIPPMTNTDRLVRPTVFGIVVLLLAGLFAETYTPVQQKDRMFPEIPVAWATVGGVVALNILVWFMWRLPPLWKFLNTYAVVVPAYPFSVSILANTFSHRSFSHLLSNMLFGVVLFGIPVHEEFGRAHWLFLYVSGGVGGSLLSHWFYCLTRQFAYYAQGASGGVFALMTAWTIMSLSKPMPSTETHHFALEVTRWAVLATSVIGHAIPSAVVGIDWVSHLGGACAGLVIGGLLHLRNVATAEHQADEKKDPSNEQATNQTEPTR